MKKLLEICGIIVFIAIIGFSFAACDSGGGGGNPRNSGADLANTSTLGDVPLTFGSESGTLAAPRTAAVKLHISKLVAAKFVHKFKSGSESATVTAYLGNNTSNGSGTYAAINSQGYNFSSPNNTLWVKVVSENGSTTKFYKITVTEQKEPNSKANIQSAVLAGKPIEGINAPGSATEEDPVTVTVEIARTDRDNAAFEFTFATDSIGATVKAYEDDGTGDGEYNEEIDSGDTFDFSEESGNDTLWLEVTPEDETSPAKYYRINVTFPALQSGTKLTNESTLGAIPLGFGNQSGTDTNNAVEAFVTLSYLYKTESAIFVPKLETLSSEATVKASLGNATAPGSYTGVNPAGYNFSDTNNTLWLEVTAQDEDAPKSYYKITVKVNNAATSKANFDFATLAGVMINGLNGQGSDTETNPVEASVQIPHENRSAAVFAYQLAADSTGATVIAYANNGDADDDYTELASNYDFSGEVNTLWVKVIPEDGTSPAKIYKIAVTFPTLQTGARLASASLGGKPLSITGQDSPILVNVEIPNTQGSNATFVYNLATNSNLAKVEASLGGETQPSSFSPITSGDSFNFTGPNKVLWVKVAPQDGTATIYKITVTVTPTLQSGTRLMHASLADEVISSIINVDGADSEAAASAVTVNLPTRAAGTGAKFTYTKASTASAAGITAYVNNGTPENAYASIKNEGYNFTDEIDTLWIRIIAEDGTTRYFKINVVLPALQSGAGFDGVRLGSAIVNLGAAGAQPSAAATSDLVQLNWTQRASANFSYELNDDSSEAEVTILSTDIDAETPLATEITSKNFSGLNLRDNRVLWIKVVPENEEEADTRYYKVEIAANTGTSLASATLGNTGVSFSGNSASITIPYSQRSTAQFTHVLASGSEGAKVTAYADNGTSNGNGPFADILPSGYDFANGNTRLWVSVESESRSSWTYYIDVTVREETVEVGDVDITLSVDGIVMVDEGDESVEYDGNPIILDRSDNNNVTIEFAEGLDITQWSIGSKIEDFGDDDTSITLNAADYFSGDFILSLYFVKDGKLWQREIKFSVRD
jgi:hypothetical protein